MANGTIHAVGKLRDGTRVWRVTYELPHAVGGRNTVRRRVRGTRSEAQAVLDSLRVDVARGTYVTDRERTVGHLLTRWMAEHVPDLEPQTRSTYERYVRLHLRPALGDVRIADLRQSVVRDAMEGLTTAPRREGGETRPVGAQTRLHAFRCLHACLSWAAEQELIPPVVAQRLRAPRVDSEARPVLSPSELVAVFDELDGWRRVVVVLAGACGLRRGEVCGLRWSDVRFRAGALTVAGNVRMVGKVPEWGPTKGKRSRSVPVPGFAMAALQEQLQRQNDIRLVWPGWNPEGWVVPTDEGTLRRPGSLSAMWRRVARTRGYPGVTLHDLRHSYASLRLRAGDYPARVAAIVGHKDAATTQRIYAHVIEEIEADADDLMDGVFDAVRAPRHG